MILLIDNFDSFSYNLFQFVGTINNDIKVIRNNEITINEIKELNPTHIILSPGPGYPRNAGICIETVKELGKIIPILGVCLGHQSICEAFGATISYAKKLMHGKQSNINLDLTCPIFKNLDKQILVGRYHSLAVVEQTIPKCLKVTAVADDNEIMAVMHKDYPIFGVQFHPESILTPNGITIIKNFLEVKE